MVQWSQETRTSGEGGGGLGFRGLRVWVAWGFGGLAVWGFGGLGVWGSRVQGVRLNKE